MCHYRKGQRVKFRGTNKKGEILEIIQDYGRIQWEHNKPLFIVVSLDTGEKVIAGVSQLKGIK